MRTLLVTGHTGFVGRAVSAVVSADASAAANWCVATLPEHFDIRSATLRERVRESSPDAVLHLAAVTSVAESFRDPETYFDINFRGTGNLLQCLQANAFGGRMLFVGSGDCYGAVDAERLPIVEDEPLRPRSPYAVSKVAAEALCYQWSQTGPFEIVIARPFNHIGPGQDVRFAVASFARQVAQMRAGRSGPEMLTGNLDVTRDLTDVRDVVRAYLALLERGRSGQVYNVASGRETRLGDVLDMLLSLAGVRAIRRVDPSRLRTDEQLRAVADVRKISRDTGWRATTPLRTTLQDTLDDWTRQIDLG